MCIWWGSFCHINLEFQSIKNFSPHQDNFLISYIEYIISVILNLIWLFRGINYFSIECNIIIIGQEELVKFNCYCQGRIITQCKLTIHSLESRSLCLSCVRTKLRSIMTNTLHPLEVVEHKSNTWIFFQ